MEIWISITIFAAFSQNIRTALQKHLTGKLSTAGATQARFFYAIPFSIIYIITLLYGFDFPLPELNISFIIYASIGGLSQIIATALLVELFSYRNFFVGVSYSKTETIQTAILGFILLSDKVTTGAVVGITLSAFGVIILSSAKNTLSVGAILRYLTTKPALIGLFSGLFFGVASVCYRGASLSLEGGYIIQAAFTLMVVLVFQAALTSVYLYFKEPMQMTNVLGSWRISWLVGLTGMLASVAWFSAVTLENAAHVKALGQVELIFTFLVSLFFFREKTSKKEFIGILTIISGILILLLYK